METKELDPLYVWLARRMYSEWAGDILLVWLDGGVKLVGVKWMKAEVHNA